MSILSNLRFNGEFRDYQKNVLDHSKQYLKDGKIHIVAAPGSGKTTLGIELIRRLNSPALILAPTVTIRQQWGERIVDSFLPSEQDAADYLSYNLEKPSLITSITYQALYAAFNKLSIKEEIDDENTENSDIIDFSNFDLLNTVKNSNIKTICLDEAHHLKNEWQKVLECFISALREQATIIALTATPPYDSTPSEWKKYTDLCGEIDEEIYVPQLVSQKTLCPHQDYIYFNYPTNKETQIFNQYKQKAMSCAEDILQSQLFDDILSKSELLTDFQGKEESILENAKGFIALLCLAKYRGIKLPKKLIKLVSPSGKLPAFSLAFAETAFQFIIDTPAIFSEEISFRLHNILSENSLIDKKQVHLKSNDKVNKLLLSSTGKLVSINEIVRSESNNLKKDLRMLILTDYIKKDLTKIIGSDETITTLGTVPIFESVRRSCGDQVDIALLSGQLVIIPKDLLQEIATIAQNKNVAYTTKNLENTNYIEINFSGSSKNKVAIITEAFGQGLIQVLVGTKSLLGEGWDSPCINSLILASFVGSFVLSNQMRGRAIRVDENAPEKVSNIWHLVTVEPEFV
ncbi:MAG: DEAD/DEAH box helicase family protein, partial [Bacteroidota bacterium]|nr:DEAD/DEAH box helicase family protein [Bacteroidota bacterium]